jgi:hypothetical protein
MMSAKWTPAICPVRSNGSIREFAAAHRSTEESFRDATIGESLASAFANLTSNERDWLKLCDDLEAYLFTLTFNRSVLIDAGWPEYRTSILCAAEDLGCLDAVRELLK